MRLFWAVLLIFHLTGCTSTRTPIPTGEIPTQGQVSLEDEEYGQQVYRELAGQFTIDRDDARINRARRLVDELTTVRGNNQNIWHVHVFQHPTFHNAGATRGNYIFIWSALLDAVPDDGELTTILAHEIGHVLAGHTQPDPAEEVNRMLADLAGRATRDIMVQTGGNTVIGLAGLGGLLAAELLKAFIVNPDNQDDELEADQLGLFIMAEAGYNPEKAITFWERAKNDPNFKSAAIEFLSSHPSSDTRLEALKKVLPEAMARYNGGNPIIPPPTTVVSNSSTAPAPSAVAPTSQNPPAPVQSSPPPPQSSAASNSTVGRTSDKGSYWIAADDKISVFASPSKSSKKLGHISKGERVLVDHRLRRWLVIEDPYEGFVESPHFFPEK